MARFARFGAAGVGFALLSTSTVMAQSAGTPSARGPSAALNDALQRGQSNPQETPQALSEEIDPTGGPPYRTPDGRYVTPDPNSPDGWSPAQRLYPDYGQYRSNDSFRNRSYGQRDEMRSNQQYQGYYAYPQGGCAGGEDLGDAYNQGRYDARHDYLWHLAQQRAGRLLNQYAQMFDDGLQAFYDGRYDRAAINLIGAADKNQASAGARLHAGHALFALGQYQDAMVHIVRAFELSPGLAHKTYDIREEYGDPSQFDRHVANLRRFVAANPRNVAGLSMLGYVTFYSGNPGGAYEPLARASLLDPHSYFIPKLLDLARVTQSVANAPAGTPAPYAQMPQFDRRPSQPVAQAPVRGRVPTVRQQAAPPPSRSAPSERFDIGPTQNSEDAVKRVRRV